MSRQQKLDTILTTIKGACSEHLHEFTPEVMASIQDDFLRRWFQMNDALSKLWQGLGRPELKVTSTKSREQALVDYALAKITRL
jgi:hypothetical protein